MNSQNWDGTGSCPSIRILVVDDDSTSLTLVAAILRSWKYEVFTAKHPFDALATLRRMQGQIDLVVTDYHMPEMNGIELQKQVQEEFDLPVILMSIDDRDFIMLESLGVGAVFFLIKPIQREQVRNVWQYVGSTKKGKSSVEIKEIGSDPIPSNAAQMMDEEANCGIVVQDVESASSGITTVENNNRQKRKEEQKKKMTKKQKIVWTSALHTLFLQAINHIGLDKAVPKKILELMEVPGLTRQNVASHLQKYRIFLRNVAGKGLVKWNDPQKALTDAFASSMAAATATAQDAHNTSSSMQFQPKSGRSSSVLAVQNRDASNFSKGHAYSGLASTNKLEGSNPLPPVAVTQPTWKPPVRTNYAPICCGNTPTFPVRRSRSNLSRGFSSKGHFTFNPRHGIQAIGSSMPQQQSQVIPKPFHSQSLGNGHGATDIIAIGDAGLFGNNLHSLGTNPNGYVGTTWVNGNQQLYGSVQQRLNHNPCLINGLGIGFDGTKGALILGRRGATPVRKMSSNRRYITQGESSSSRFGIGSSTFVSPDAKKYEDGAAKEEEKNWFAFDELVRTFLSDESNQPMLDDGEFNSIISTSLSQQGYGDINMEPNAAQPGDHPAEEDQNFDDDEFIKSLLIDAGPFMEIEPTSSIPPDQGVSV